MQKKTYVGCFELMGNDFYEFIFGSNWNESEISRKIFIFLEFY